MFDHTTRLADDERASATGVMNFLLSLGGGVILAFILNFAGKPLIEFVRPRATGPTSTSAVTYADTFIEYWPVAMVFTCFFSFIALSVFRRELR